MFRNVNPFLLSKSPNGSPCLQYSTVNKLERNKLTQRRYYEKNQEKLKEKQREYRRRIKEEALTGIPAKSIAKLTQPRKEVAPLKRTKTDEERKAAENMKREKKKLRQKRYYLRHREKKSEYNKDHYSLRLDKEIKEALSQLETDLVSIRVGSTFHSNIEYKAELEKELDITQPEDWYRVTRKKLISLDKETRAKKIALVVPYKSLLEVSIWHDIVLTFSEALSNCGVAIYIFKSGPNTDMERPKAHSAIYPSTRAILVH